MMSYVDYTVAMDLISKKTKQQCNAFTILHYIRNQLLDLFFEADGEFDACECLILDKEDDSSIIARRIFSGYQDYLRLNISEMTDTNLFEFITGNGQLKATLFKKADIGLDYILLSEKLEVKRNLIDSECKEAKRLLKEIEPLYHEGASPIHLSFVITLLGIIQNKVFELKDVKFSLDQIKKLQNKPIVQLNPKASNYDIRNKRMELGRKLGIKFCKEILTSNLAKDQDDLGSLVNCALKCFNQERDQQTIIDWCKGENLLLPPKKNKK